MSSGYFNFDVELGNLGELYAINCFTNMIQVKGYHGKGSEVVIEGAIDLSRTYCIKRMTGLSIMVTGMHLAKVQSALGRETIPFEAIVEAHIDYDKLMNLTLLTKENLHETLIHTEEDKRNLKENHSDMAHKSEYDFWLRFLNTPLNKFRVEVKTDAQSPKTGNIFIEYEQNTDASWEMDWDLHAKKSGMMISKSEIWAYLVSPEVFLLIHPDKLMEYYERRNTAPLRVVSGGDKTDNENNPRTRGILIPIQFMLDLDLSLTKENRFSSTPISMTNTMVSMF